MGGYSLGICGVPLACLFGDLGLTLGSILGALGTQLCSRMGDN